MSRPGEGAGPWFRQTPTNPWRSLFFEVPSRRSHGAERALGEHLADKYKPNRAGGRHPSEILIADDLWLHHLRTGHQDPPSGVDP
jgi:hypothetical protein